MTTSMKKQKQEKTDFLNIRRSHKQISRRGQTSFSTKYTDSTSEHQWLESRSTYPIPVATMYQVCCQMRSQSQCFLSDSIVEYGKQLRFPKTQNRYRLLVDQLPNGMKKLHIKGKRLMKNKRRNVLSSFRYGCSINSHRTL